MRLLFDRTVIYFIESGEGFFGGYRLRNQAVVDIVDVGFGSEIVVLVHTVHEIGRHVVDGAVISSVLLGREGFGGSRLHISNGHFDEARIR